ncbi:21599_t:CDS:2, partial [Cetraspora pellucida]
NIRNPNIGHLRRSLGTFGYSLDDAAKEAQGPSLLKHTCLELSKLLCYHEILEKDLCSTVMEDKTYWQNRRSYFTPGDNEIDDNISSSTNSMTNSMTNLSSKSSRNHEMFGKLFIKESINSNNKLLEPSERNSENITRPATMGSLLRTSASTLSLNSSSSESSRTSLSTYGDNEEGYNFHGNVSEYELDDRDDCSFRDDASSIIALDDVKEQLSSINGCENDDYDTNLIDIETNLNGKRNSDGIKICVTEFTEVTSEHEDDSKNQLIIPRIQSNLKSKSKQDEKTIMKSDLGINSNKIIIPVLVISKADD